VVYMILGQDNLLYTKRVSRYIRMLVMIHTLKRFPSNRNNPFNTKYIEWYSPYMIWTILYRSIGMKWLNKSCINLQVIILLYDCLPLHWCIIYY